MSHIVGGNIYVWNNLEVFLTYWPTLLPKTKQFLVHPFLMSIYLEFCVIYIQRLHAPGYKEVQRRPDDC